MNHGLEQVKTALVEALEQSGLRARAAFSPGWAEAYDEPVAAVGLRTGESRGGAMHSYLGCQLDRETLAYREIYGMRLDLTLSLDLYAPARVGVSGCDQALETLHQALLTSLPAGLRGRELKWEEAGWDEETGMFLRRGSLVCDAFFTAIVSEDGVLLSDFILKGVVTK